MASPPTASRRRWRATLAGDEGSASTEFVIAAPLLLILLLGAVQAGVWWHSVHIAESVAAHALAAARVHGGTTASGQAAGQRVLTQLGARLLEGATVEVQRNAEQAQVEVTATTVSVVPGLSLPVHARATGPAEPAP